MAAEVFDDDLSRPWPQWKVVTATTTRAFAATLVIIGVLLLWNPLRLLELDDHVDGIAVVVAVCLLTVGFSGWWILRPTTRRSLLLDRSARAFALALAAITFVAWCR